jgi:hypothetical protein
VGLFLEKSPTFLLKILVPSEFHRSSTIFSTFVTAPHFPIFARKFHFCLVSGEAYADTSPQKNGALSLRMSIPFTDR